jgi:hypothetical protein
MRQSLNKLPRPERDCVRVACLNLARAVPSLRRGLGASMKAANPTEQHYKIMKMM